MKRSVEIPKPYNEEKGLEISTLTAHIGGKNDT